MDSVRRKFILVSNGLGGLKKTIKFLTLFVCPYVLLDVIICYDKCIGLLTKSPYILLSSSSLFHTIQVDTV